ncbi:acyl-CoA N-acyltransferase [Xylariaceae sp. FL0255]|nr:acyl-CoA N-acyltransferase [Xylariaceae sp. FL0255]
MSHTIRLREPDDIATCVEILKQVYELSGYPIQGVDNAARALQTNDQAWVAISQRSKAPDRIIGHVALNAPRKGNVGTELWLAQHPEDQSHIAALGWLFVSPASRGAGTASTLVRTVLDEARKRGFRRVILFALVKDQEAIRLYRRLGWEHFGTAVYHWGEKGQEREMDAECFASTEL